MPHVSILIVPEYTILDSKERKLKNCNKELSMPDKQIRHRFVKIVYLFLIALIECVYEGKKSLMTSQIRHACISIMLTCLIYLRVCCESLE